MEKCPECGLPMVECSAVASGRLKAEEFMRENGYSALEARNAARRLIPPPSLPAHKE